MHNRYRIGKNEVIPISDKSALSEEAITVAAVRYVAGEPRPMDVESDSDKEADMAPKDPRKTIAARKKAVKFVHKQEGHQGPETDKMMPMYIKIKQMSLFPSIY